MKFHIKSGLIFLLITIILLVGMTAISASDAVDTEIQDNIKHTEVSTTTTTTSMAKSSVAETIKNDVNLKEEETTIEKVNNTKTINKTDTTRSSNNAVKTYDPNKAIYVSLTAHENSYDYNWNTQQVSIHETGTGTYWNPCSIYYAIQHVQQDGVVILLHDQNSQSSSGETVYETRPNAPWVDTGGTYYPGGPNNPNSGINTFTIMGEEGYTIVWSGLRHNTNMLSVSKMYNVTVQNIVFRDGNASGIASGEQGRAGATADKGGAIDNRGALHLINCTFDSIIASENGGAIANYESANTLIENCTFRNITSTAKESYQDGNTPYGGAISLRKDTSVTPQVTVKNSNFTDIEAEYGGVFLNDQGIFTVENVNINNATATKEGGVIVNLNSGTFDIKNINITNITASEYGGAIANLGGTVSIENLNVTNAKTTASGTEDDLYGGTIFNNGTSSTLTIKDSTFNNVSADFGAVFSNIDGQLSIENVNITNANAQTEGGAIVNKGGKTTITNVNMTDLNSHMYGGAVANLKGNVTMKNVNITDVDIEYLGHGSGMYGGTIYNKGNLTIEDSTL